MEPLILAMLVINGAVAGVAVLIAVQQQRFHRRVENRLKKAIENVQNSIDNDIKDVRKGIESHITKRTEIIDQGIEQRMQQMEWRFYAKLEDKDTYGPLVKSLTDNLHQRFMNESRAIKKKVGEFEDKLKGAAETGDYSQLISMDWDDDRGLFGNIARNIGPLSKALNPQNAPEPEPAPSSGEGAPTWWSQEDQQAMERFVQEREELHKVNIAP